MVYSLVSGAQNYNTRLHYSLYGGVEFLPDHTLAWKELLPLAAIPAVAITLLVALLNFHIPKLSPQTGGNSAGVSQAGDGSSLIISNTSNSVGSPPASGTKNANSAGAPTSTSRTATTPVTIIPSGTVGPVSTGNDDGQGIIGRGGDGGSSPAPAPTIGTSTPVGSASVGTSATTQPTTSQTTVTASLPLTGTNVSITAGL